MNNNYRYIIIILMNIIHNKTYEVLIYTVHVHYSTLDDLEKEE